MTNMQTSGNRWWTKVIPAVARLRTYDRSWFRFDLVAGITLAAYLLPAALGDASLANLPPEAGLYACLFAGLVFWVFCGSRQTVVSVTSAISLVVGLRREGIDQRLGGVNRFTSVADAIDHFLKEVNDFRRDLA